MVQGTLRWVFLCVVGCNLGPQSLTLKCFILRGFSFIKIWNQNKPSDIIRTILLTLDELVPRSGVVNVRKFHKLLGTLLQESSLDS